MFFSFTFFHPFVLIPGQFRIISHYGSEYYCTLTTVRVYGRTLIEELRTEASILAEDDEQHEREVVADENGDDRRGSEKEGAAVDHQTKRDDEESNAKSQAESQVQRENSAAETAVEGARKEGLKTEEDILPSTEPKKPERSETEKDGRRDDRSQSQGSAVESPNAESKEANTAEAPVERRTLFEKAVSETEKREKVVGPSASVAAAATTVTVLGDSSPESAEVGACKLRGPLPGSLCRLSLHISWRPSALV